MDAKHGKKIRLRGLSLSSVLSVEEKAGSKMKEQNDEVCTTMAWTQEDDRVDP